MFKTLQRIGKSFMLPIATAPNMVVFATRRVPASFMHRTGVVLNVATATVIALYSVFVLPLVAPAAPYIGGAMVAAGLFKWLTDADKRRLAEIRDKRQAIEGLLRSRLLEAFASFSGQLDQLQADFAQAERALLQPVLLNAQAASRLPGLQQALAERVDTLGALGDGRKQPPHRLLRVAHHDAQQRLLRGQLVIPVTDGCNPSHLLPPKRRKLWKRLREGYDLVALGDSLKPDSWVYQQLL